jgi:hypothetical protein
MQIKCSRCGGDVQVVTDDQFVECSYCHTSLFLHFEGNSEHYLLKPSIAQKIIQSILEKWLRHHDYSGTPGIMNARLVYFPFWLFQTVDSNTLVPAAPDPTCEIHNLSFGGADMRLFSSAECAGAQVIPASLYVSVARTRYMESGVRGKQVKAEHLLHYPLFVVRYGYGDSEYVAVIDAVSGIVYSHDLPPPESAARSRRFIAMAAMAFLAFFVVDMALDSFPLELLLDTVVGIGMYFLGRTWLESGAPVGGQD